MAAQYAGALAAIEADNAERASGLEISEALSVLVAVCAKPADMDDAKVLLWHGRLKQVMGEYPRSVALAAISEWPKAESGKWWPTENELREQCEERMAFRQRLQRELDHLRSAANRPPPPPQPSDGMSDEPSGDTAEFVARYKAKDAARAELYLKQARYTANSIGVPHQLAQFMVQRAVREEGFNDVLVKRPGVYREDNSVAEWVL